jgi:hypothetical protein
MQQEHRCFLFALLCKILKAKLYIIHSLLMVFNEITRKVDLVAFFFLSPQVRKLGDIERSHVEK